MNNERLGGCNLNFITKAIKLYGPGDPVGTTNDLSKYICSSSQLAFHHAFELSSTAMLVQTQVTRINDYCGCQW